MTVAELIETLQSYPADTLVIMSSDSEGNSYDTLYNLGLVKYDKKNREVGLIELTEDDIKAGYSKEDVMKKGVKAICLWP